MKEKTISPAGSGLIDTLGYDVALLDGSVLLEEGDDTTRLFERVNADCERVDLRHRKRYLRVLGQPYGPMRVRLLRLPPPAQLSGVSINHFRRLHRGPPVLLSLEALVVRLERAVATLER